MDKEIYKTLANVLNTLPNGFPSTQSGVEIKLLRKLFTSEQATLFCNLRLTYESAKEISTRATIPLENLDDKLKHMWEQGLIASYELNGKRVYKMVPWMLGIYEFQLKRMDHEFCELCEEYLNSYGIQYFQNQPQQMRVVPIERKIEGLHQALPYEMISSLIEKGISFGIEECVCKKEAHILGNGCNKPRESCLGIAPVPDGFKDLNWGRPISKKEAYKIIETAEAFGLVHMIYNSQQDHYFICNCCGCCCNVLRGINKLNIPAGWVVSSNYHAAIDTAQCSECGICVDERCQVAAIEKDHEGYQVVVEKCIGCGLCVTTCPTDAIRLVRKNEIDCEIPPKDEEEWFKMRGINRGVEFSLYK
jgi:Fe-S-cluster-containing hydrogenase component 2